MRHSKRFCQILKASWKSCFVRVFSTACDSAWITSAVTKWRLFSIFFGPREQGKVGWVGDDSHVVFGKKKIAWRRRKYETVRCRYATVGFFVAEVHPSA
jgi:hypothetical protein